VAEVVECLLCTYKALSSNPSPTRKKEEGRKERKKERKKEIAE
jgi:hypothetical protein